MLKKIISVLTAFLILPALFDFTAVCAESAEELSGSCGTSVTYTLTDNDSDGYYEKLVISGTGKTAVDIPDALFDIPVIFVEEDQRVKVSENGHEHNYDLGVCQICGVSVNGFAANGNCGANGDNAGFIITRNNDDDANPTYTITISGTGDMANYDYKLTGCPYLSYAGQITNVVIEDGITSVGEYDFCSFQAITSVTIPSTVTVIGKNAFYRCSSLTSAEIPEGVKEIGSYAFDYCYALQNVTLPQSLETIKNSAFGYCSFTSITIPGGVKKIDSYAFSECSLTSVTISEGVETINPGAFWPCRSLTYVSLPSTLTSIGIQAFASCESLSEIIIPENVQTIADRAFDGCENLNQIIYPASAAVEPPSYDDYYTIPETATQVKYEVTDNGKIKITDIILGTNGDLAVIPEIISGREVEPIDKELMKFVAHNHEGGTATCTEKAECELCGGEYGEPLGHSFTNYIYNDDATCTEDGTETANCDNCDVTDTRTAADTKTVHSYADGVCTKCGDKDPDYSKPAATTPTGGPSSYPSGPSNAGGSSVITTAVVTTAVVTTVTAEEEGFPTDYTGDDVSASAGVYEEETEITERACGASAVYAVLFAGLIIAVKKRYFQK